MKLIKKLIFFIVVIAILILTIFIVQGYKMYNEALKESSLEEKIKQIKSDKNYTRIEELPKNYINAVIAAEDHRFYKHGAVDLKSIGRAIVTNIKEGKFAEGGSTITQQVAKNIYFTQRKQLTRKVAELFMAFNLERNCSKEQILELYVNTSYFGDGYTGVKEAANGYFNKEPKDLSLAESTILAGIPNAPSVYAPTKNPELTKKRQAQVIKKMVKNGYLTQEEADKI